MKYVPVGMRKKNFFIKQTEKPSMRSKRKILRQKDKNSAVGSRINFLGWVAGDFSFFFFFFHIKKFIKQK